MTRHVLDIGVRITRAFLRTLNKVRKIAFRRHSILPSLGHSISKDWFNVTEEESGGSG